MSPFLIWFLAGAVLILFELFSPIFITVFFGLGAWVVSATLLAAELSTAVQFALFALSSLALLLLLRGTVRRVFSGRAETEEEVRGRYRAGERAKVVRAIPAGGMGQISYRGSFWPATADVRIPDQAVVVLVSEVSGSKGTFVVRPATENDTVGVNDD